MHGSNETVAKLARFMCGRAIKPVRLPRRTTELLRLRHSEYVTCDGPMARRRRGLGKCLRLGGVAAEFCDSLIRPVHFTSANLPLIHEDRVKEIARTRTNLRLPPTYGCN